MSLFESDEVHEIDFAEVTVVIPCYRCQESIDRAVASIYSQTLRPSEVILVDDYSDDGTLELLYKLRDNYPAGWIKVVPLERNSGPATARNRGWNLATFPYVAFLDSDDSWDTHKIEFQYNWMKLNPDASLTGQSYDEKKTSGLSLDEVLTANTFKVVSANTLLMSNKFTTSSVMLKRDISFRFLDGKRYCEDYLLWCDICCSGLLCYSINYPLSIAYKPAYGSAGLSANLWKMELGELSVYKSMYKQSFIDFRSCAIYYSWSLLRYLRRLLKTKLG